MGSSTDDGLQTVACPECGREVPISLPRSGEVVAVAAGGTDGSEDLPPEERRRRLSQRCPEDHSVTVTYDW